jgi:hypothetical protein
VNETKKLMSLSGFTKCEWVAEHRGVDAVAYVEMLHKHGLVLMCGGCADAVKRLGYDIYADLRSDLPVGCPACGRDYPLDKEHWCNGFQTPAIISKYEECGKKPHPSANSVCVLPKGSHKLHSNSTVVSRATVVWED